MVGDAVAYLTATILLNNTLAWLQVNIFTLNKRDYVVYWQIESIKLVSCFSGRIAESATRGSVHTTR